MSFVSIMVALLVSSQSGLTPAAVQQLREDVSRIYADAKVQIDWVEHAGPGAVTITIVRSLPPIPGCESAFGCSIIESRGATPPVAFIASRAIWDHEVPRPLLRGRLLGYVVAHELGHLLGLPHGNARGIMYHNTSWLPHVRWAPAEQLALRAILDQGDVPAGAHVPEVVVPTFVLNADRSRTEP